MINWKIMITFNKNKLVLITDYSLLKAISENSIFLIKLF